MELLGWNAKGVINVSLAGIVGVLGSIAFYYGVYTGFIGRSSRAETLQYLSGSTNRFHYIAMFYVLGGVVAGVFRQRSLIRSHRSRPSCLGLHGPLW